MKKLAYGVGMRNKNTIVTESVNVGGRVKILWKCPYFSRWENMLERCYSVKFKENVSTYDDCHVCDEWLQFESFKDWMKLQSWKGMDLDKDLLVMGNKKYSPETCIFINPLINKFIIERIPKSTGLQGVYLSVIKSSDKSFVSKFSNPLTNKTENLGRYNTPEEAHLAWKARKHELACQLADSEYVTDERVANALRTRYK